MAVPMRKALLEETSLALGGLDLVSCLCLVRASKLTINQLMWPLLTTRLGSLLARRSSVHTKGLLLESSKLWTQLRRNLHFGVLGGIFLPSMIGILQCANLSLVVLGRHACNRIKLVDLPLVGIIVEVPSKRRGLNSKCCRPLGVPGTKKEEEEVNVVCF
jgi:hypothetical protein